MAKTLKLWNGRPYGVLNRSEWNGVHVYVAAYSVADARRVCVEAGCYDPGANEIKVYWSECWGTAMQGIQPERGLWVTYEYGGKPIRKLPTTE